MQFPVAMEPRRRRRSHRILTIPSGVVVFLCLFLPGYRECGSNVAMADKPILAAICIAGLVVAIAALPGRHAAERAVAALCAGASGLATGITALALAASETYIGVRLAMAGLVGLAAGCTCWMFEVLDDDKPSPRPMPVVAMTVGAMLLWSTIAATSTWEPPPESHPRIDIVVH